MVERRCQASKQISGSLRSIAADIREAHAQCVKSNIKYSIRIAEMLTQAKDQVGHGGWSSRVEVNCGFKLRQASSYMRVYKNRKAIECGDVTNIEAAWTLLAPEPKPEANR